MSIFYFLALITYKVLPYFCCKLFFSALNPEPSYSKRKPSDPRLGIRIPLRLSHNLHLLCLCSFSVQLKVSLLLIFLFFLLNVCVLLETRKYIFLNHLIFLKSVLTSQQHYFQFYSNNSVNWPAIHLSQPSAETISQPQREGPRQLEWVWSRGKVLGSGSVHHWPTTHQSLPGPASKSNSEVQLSSQGGTADDFAFS